MAVIRRTESGKIVHEVFDKAVDLVADGWQLHPSADRFHFNITEGYLQMSHGDQPAYLLRELPESAVLEYCNDYNPAFEGDFGGAVAYATDDHKLELYEYYNEVIGTSLTFPYVRLVKLGEKYEGYGSQDGRNWDIRGAVKFEGASLWGIALEGLAGDPMKVYALSVYKDTKIRFKSLPSGGRVEVYSMATEQPELIANVSESAYKAEVSVFGFVMPMRIRVKVFDGEGVLVAESEYDDVFGGDVYHYGNFLEVWYDDRPLELLDNDFGYIDSFFKDFKLELRNTADVSHTDVRVEIKRYMEEFGFEWVFICRDNEGHPDGNFDKTLVVEEVPANGVVPFWIRIMRNSVPVQVDDYTFDFVINVW